MSAQVGTFLLLGASGDLSGRLLLPALGQLLEQEPERREIVLIGAGTEEWSQDEWHHRVHSSLTTAEIDEEVAAAILNGTRYVRADVTKAEDLKGLLAAGPPAPAIYFALPPAVTVASCEALREVDLPAGTVLALEKPFGTDAASAHALNRLLTQLVDEDHIQRVDHFLGRSTVLNLLGVRFANRLFEPLWNNQHIDSVTVVYDEQLTLENRARYYDRAGALADMIQSHLLQVMALIAMEPPASVDAVDLRAAKTAVLRATRPWRDDPVAASRRARYVAGTIDGRDVPNYVDEPGVDASRNTETLAEVELEVDNWRWSGVPFRLRSGKALAERRKEIVITFNPPPHLPTGLRGRASPARLRLMMGPDRMAWEMNVNGPSDPFELDRVTLDTKLSPGRLPAYGEVLAGVLDADPFLSVRGDAAEECWRILEPVIGAWRDGAVPIDDYPAGSTGPSAWPRH
ncbi:MAG TPA: glucose-6-phosphate dehydrogenase [Microlunatus sp.]|nr:glucose-6-phosphate dehydrogenase [Microlunatus sp.]